MKLALVCCVVVVLCLLINNAQCQIPGDSEGRGFVSGGNDGGDRRQTGGAGFGRGGRARRGSLMNMYPQLPPGVG